METFSPTIINSKKAKEHYEATKVKHADILTGLQNHSLRIQDYNNQKSIQKQNEDLKQAEVDKEFRAQQAVTQKESADRSIKEQEIALKREALFQPNNQ